jgi:hypothetical protein
MFVHFLIDSNVQTLCKYASNHLELTFKKRLSQTCCDTDVPADNRCVLWGFLLVNFKIKLSVVDIFIAQV